MFIFILKTELSTLSSVTQFTFHYVYIYMGYYPVCLGGIEIYIPLCLYLYSLAGIKTTVLQNLHSTMFIFICHSHYAITVLFEFTFHYVYIYIPGGKSVQKSYDIYIPLCLYLYKSIITAERSNINLHSTMFIFILYNCESESSTIFIYIPLCLYLYSVKWYKYVELYNIYIPLCLYLYVVTFMKSSNLTLFTFHYVYIYILSCRRKWFTGIIYIPLCLYLYQHKSQMERLVLYLHSTMFIFI